MNERIDVLAVMLIAGEVAASNGLYETHDALHEARAAVAELIATGNRAEVAFNTVRGCYERNPGNFAIAMRELEREVPDFRAALARVGSP